MLRPSGGAPREQWRRDRPASRRRTRVPERPDRPPSPCRWRRHCRARTPRRRGTRSGRPDAGR